jgi:hypothetical protein
MNEVPIDSYYFYLSRLLTILHGDKKWRLANETHQYYII